MCGQKYTFSLSIACIVRYYWFLKPIERVVYYMLSALKSVSECGFFSLFFYFSSCPQSLLLSFTKSFIKYPVSHSVRKFHRCIICVVTLLFFHGTQLNRIDACVYVHICVDKPEKLHCRL